MDEKTLTPWFWLELPLGGLTGSKVFRVLFLNNSSSIATLLESPFPTPQDQPQLSRYSICAGSPRIIQGKSRLWTPSVGNILTCLKQLRQKQIDVHCYPSHLPFTGGWLGWLGYDLAWEIEKLPYTKKDNLPFPVAFWYEPESFAILDHQEQILWLASSNELELAQLQCKVQCLIESNFLNPSIQATIENPLSSALTFISNQEDYEASVSKALKYIQSGDIFQTNLSLRFHSTTNQDSWQIYRRLQTINPSPFASYWQTPWGVMISCSPERLIELQGNTAQTRPIAGTRPRGNTPEQDQQFAQELLSNTKEKAEHIMLIDLERNDLGRVCQWGSVEVNELLTIERYSHVMHLVSNIKGQLLPEYDSIDLIRALFPGGTITGCPKVRCMEIIEELEPMRRSLFYGSCGYLDHRGNLDLNILIRTLLLAQNNAHSNFLDVWGQVGAGIVADSIPQKEWLESLQKAQAQIKAIYNLGVINY